MKKIFISHSILDKEVAEKVVSFLKNGIGVSTKSIFCSSLDGYNIPIGVNFNDYIRNNISNSDGVITIAIISNNYYNSKYCLYELGAAWGLGNDNKIFPLLIKGMKYGNLQDFIYHTQAIDGANKEDINKFADQIRYDILIEKENIGINSFEKERDNFLNGIKYSNEEYIKQNKKGTNNKKSIQYKLVALDFDGVILQGKNYKHSWQSIWDFLHYEDSIRMKLYNKHRDNPQKYTFQDWCNECVRYFRDRDFSKDQVAQIIEKKGLKIADGFNELISVLNKLNIKVIIISGGIDTFIESVIDANTIQLIDKIFVNRFIYDKDGLLQSVEAYQNIQSDSVGKTKILESYCLENDIDPSEVVYVGDEVNDIDAMQTVGKAIVYPGATASPYTKEIKNFSVVYNQNIIYVLPEML